MNNDTQSTTKTTINTDGGSYIGGDVNTGGGSFAGRDNNVTNNTTIIVNNVEDAQKIEAEIDRKIALFTGSFTRLTFEPKTVLISDAQFLEELSPIDFRLGKYPVTNAQYAEFLAQNTDQPVPRSADWRLRKPRPQKDQHPVVGINWYAAVAYCAWLSQETGWTYRLPQQAEWKRAAQGPTPRRYPWGDSWQEDAANVEGQATTSVTAHPAGASPYGCLDMLGNVQEWTVTQSSTDPDERIHCGGYYDDTAQELHCEIHDTSHAESQVPWRGFRVLLELL